MSKNHEPTLRAAMLKPEVQAYIGGLNDMAFWRLRKHDPTFPKPRRLTAKRIAWIRTELDAWLASRPEAPSIIERPTNSNLKYVG